MLLTSILELHSDRITCEGLIPRNSPFAVGLNAPSFVAVELAAQAAGLLELCGELREGDRPVPRSGYLVRVRRARFATPLLNVDEPVIVRATRTGAAPPLFSYATEVSVDGEPVFSGQLSIYANST